MSMTPGPRSIERDRNPGGLIVHVYDISTGVQLVERELTPGMTVADIQLAVMEDDKVMRDHAAGSSAWIVFYDGDTGERVNPAEAIARMQ